jgi:hypothetical protein
MTLQAQYLLEGGGEYRTIGVAAIAIGDVGNLTTDTFTVNYPAPSPTPPAPGNVPGTETENTGAPLPMIDTDSVPKNAIATGGSSPFRAVNQQTTLPSSVGLLVQLKSGDGPGFGDWDSDHPVTGNDWTTVTGGITFQEFVVAYSSSSPQTYLSLNQASWSMNLAGNNDGTDEWVKGTASGDGVTGDSVLSGIGSLVAQTRGYSYKSQVKIVHTP